jgi:diaminohydroxyphosphoribosylaminopyrimidine deaminase/5-amino-6-(5-phosphoribosylamino)uracil reductase
VWLVCRETAQTAGLQACGVEIVRMPEMDTASILQELGKRRIMRLLVEGGGEVASSFLKANLVDRISVFRAGAVLGGDGRSAVAALGVGRLDFAPRFSLHSSRIVGGDTLETWRRAP